MDIKDKKEKKKLSKSTVIIIGIALTIVIICAALYLFLIYPQTYVGKIGNEIISTKEYKFMLVSRKASMLQMVGLQPGQDPQSEAAFWETDLGGSKAIDIVKKGALEDIKKIKVQAIKAKEAGLKLTSDDLKGLDNYLSSLAAQYENGKIGLEDELKNAYDMTVTQFKNLYKDIILGSKIQSKLQGEYEIFDSDIEKTYNENKKELDIATVRHILVTVEDMTNEDQKAEGKAKADAILARIKAGEDMVTLAKELSQDPGVTENEGIYSFDSKGLDPADSTGQTGYVPQFPEWAFADDTKIGSLGVVETDYGYHVMRLENMTTFEDRKEQAKQYLIGKLYYDDVTKWLEEITFKLNDDMFSSIN